LIEHLIIFFFREISLPTHIKISMPFSISFASSSMIFLFFVCQSCRRSFCLFFRYSCVFSRFFI
jgi:hypothetical protein